MTLIIKPVKVNRSVYIRIPNDIADLIGLGKSDEFNLRLEDNDNEIRLIYSRLKPLPVTQTDKRITRPIIATR